MKARAMKRSAAPIFEVVDIESLRAEKPLESILRVPFKAKPKVISCPLFIAGGGAGGVAAALAAIRSGQKVCLVEPTSWLGGQLTAQGVSALDENYLVETSGSTASYQELRRLIREHYKKFGAKDGNARFGPGLDPGNSWVSRLAFEPAVAVSALESLLAEALKNKQLRIFYRHLPVQVKIARGKVASVVCFDLDNNRLLEFRCRFCIDATELGDLLPLANIDYRSGVESKDETVEEHAPVHPEQDNVQDFTYPFAVEFKKGEAHVIAKPPNYETFNKSGKFTFAGFKMFVNNGDKLPFWEYRRLIHADSFPPAVFKNDVAMINWESNDLGGENIIDKSPSEVVEKLALAKNLSLGFLYWLQTEAPRDEGGKGYPELKLCPEIMDTQDGLSKFPYIRESRRLKASYTICEKDIGAAYHSGVRAKIFADSIGIGLYPIDIHGKQESGAAQATKPFQIPCGSLVQTRLKNFLPACKNIGTTHITNGAYRLHPIEWSIGESAGYFASMCLTTKKTPEKIWHNKKHLRTLQNILVNAGIPLFWYDDLPVNDPAFAAVQFLSVAGLLPVAADSLHFGPEEHFLPEALSTVLPVKIFAQAKGLALTMTKAELASWLYEMIIKGKHKNIQQVTTKPGNRQQ
jgi:hypothetical protein